MAVKLLTAITACPSPGILLPSNKSSLIEVFVNLKEEGVGLFLPLEEMRTVSVSVAKWF